MVCALLPGFCLLAGCAGIQRLKGRSGITVAWRRRLVVEVVTALSTICVISQHFDGVGVVLSQLKAPASSRMRDGGWRSLGSTE